MVDSNISAQRVITALKTFESAKLQVAGYNMKSLKKLKQIHLTALQNLKLAEKELSAAKKIVRAEFITANKIRLIPEKFEGKELGWYPQYKNLFPPYGANVHNQWHPEVEELSFEKQLEVVHAFNNWSWTQFTFGGIKSQFPDERLKTDSRYLNFNYFEHVIPLDSIRSGEIMYQNCNFQGLKFFDANQKVLLAIGSIDSQQCRDNLGWPIVRFQLLDGERIIGVQSRESDAHLLGLNCEKTYFQFLTWRELGKYILLSFHHHKQKALHSTRSFYKIPEGPLREVIKYLRY